MHRSRLTPLALVLLLVLVALAQTGCVLDPACDPNSEFFDLSECETPELFSILNYWAYGGWGEGGPGTPATCPLGLVCSDPGCLPVEQNGGFERGVVRWYGDEVQTSATACEAEVGLVFRATAPSGSGPSVASQVFQVYDYRALIPPEGRTTMRRVRVQADVQADPTSIDRLFGVLIQAYAGNPATFPRSGDPEVFLPGVSGLLGETFQTTPYSGDGTEWQSMRGELWLPVGTDYFVVFLEAIEDMQNDETPPELSGHFMDNVQVVIDGGNTAPVAAPDQAQTPENQAVVVAVLRNDQDRTSRLDPASVVIEQPSAFGMALPNPNGTITFTPAPGFTGNASFAYSVADEEGLRSNEATVSIIVYEQDGSCPAQSLLVCTNANAPFCEQRVVQGDFVGFVFDPTNVPTQPGRWSGFGLAAVGPSQGIIPCKGSQMLQFGSTADNNAAEIFLPIVQLVDLSDAASQAAIAGGDVTLKARALFNRVAGDAETDTRFDIAVRAYEGDPSEYPQRVTMPIGFKSLMLFSDADPGTWEEAYVELPLDPRTTYVAVRLFSYENVVNDFPPTIEFDGHYVDNVLVVLDRE